VAFNVELNMKAFWLSFVPLFVAVDAIGVLPMFMSLSQGIDPARVRRVVFQSVITALAVALFFMAIGTALLHLLGITLSDFMIAGGILLFVISMSDLLSHEKSQRRVDPDSLGAVPLGVPLLAGPALLTTSVLLTKVHGFPVTVIAVAVNILLAGVLFRFASSVQRILGKTGEKIVSKIASLLLAAYAVMMVRKGIELFLL
jgi:multiple antibiotic resistance protein